MSFQKECSLTLLLGVMVLAFVCGLLYYKLEDCREDVRMLRQDNQRLSIMLDDF